MLFFNSILYVSARLKLAVWPLGIHSLKQLLTDIKINILN